MKKIKKIWIFFLILFLIVFIILGSVKFTYSKYVSANKIAVFSGIATPKCILETKEKETIENLNLEKIYYEFCVKNFDENKNLSEIKFKYNIIFELSQENAPIKINLYRKTLNGNKKIDLENNQTINSEVLDLGMIENNYIVEVFYDTNSVEIMDDNFKISVVVQAVQEEVLNENTN